MTGPQPFEEVMAALVGQRMPGGCDDCSAYQTVTVAGPLSFVVSVHHDETCPAYTQIRKANRR